MKIRIDADSCQGSGYCAELAPDVFALRDGVAVALVDEPTSPEQEVLVLEAETLCPASAILL